MVHQRRLFTNSAASLVYTCYPDLMCPLHGHSYTECSCVALWPIFIAKNKEVCCIRYNVITMRTRAWPYSALTPNNHHLFDPVLNVPYIMQTDMFETRYVCPMLMQTILAEILVEQKFWYRTPCSIRRDPEQTNMVEY